MSEWDLIADLRTTAASYRLHGGGPRTAALLESAADCLVNCVHPLGQGVGQSRNATGRCLDEAAARSEALLIAGSTPARGQFL